MRRIRLEALAQTYWDIQQCWRGYPSRNVSVRKEFTTNEALIHLNLIKDESKGRGVLHKMANDLSQDIIDRSENVNRDMLQHGVSNVK